MNATRHWSGRNPDQCLVKYLTETDEVNYLPTQPAATAPAVVNSSALITAAMLLAVVIAVPTATSTEFWYKAVASLSTA